MNYRITNNTDKLGKRDDNYNTTLKITYTDEMEKKELFLKPGNVLYFKTNSLPLSVHKLRVQNLVSVEEISDRELKDIQTKKETNKKTSTTTTTTKKPKSKTKKKSTSKKSTTKKSTTSGSTSKKSINTSSSTKYNTDKDEDNLSDVFGEE